MVNAYSNQPLDEIWKMAYPLHEAWHYFAQAPLKEQYAQADGRASSRAIQILMEADVRAFLLSGELSALGYRTSPDLSGGPVIISKSLFGASAVNIDWHESEMIGLGRRFEDVRVCRLIDVANENPAESVPARQLNKRGPRGYADIFEEAYESLELEHPHFSDWVREKQVIEIQGKAAAMHPGRFRGGSPGRSTVYRFLSDRQR